MNDAECLRALQKKIGNCLKMENTKNNIKGGVIIMGSLFWENEGNAIQEKKSKDLAKKRKQWRTTHLDVEKKERHKLPIRYGRCSSSRKCTYTMVFSSLALNRKSYGRAVPYKEVIDFSNYLHFERQAKLLAEVEGISKGDDRLRKSWACIGVYVNPNSSDATKSTINQYWDNLRMTDSEYATKNAKHYRFRDLDGDYSLLDDNYRIKPAVKIDTKIDFLFFTYTRAEHRNKNNQKYPTPEEIAGEINRSGYDTYFEENRESDITTFEDEEIQSYLT